MNYRNSRFCRVFLSFRRNLYYLCTVWWSLRCRYVFRHLQAIEIPSEWQKLNDKTRYDDDTTHKIEIPSEWQNTLRHNFLPPRHNFLLRRHDFLPLRHNFLLPRHNFDRSSYLFDRSGYLFDSLPYEFLPFRTKKTSVATTNVATDAFF